MPMRTNAKTDATNSFRVLIVDDNRDGADASGLLIEVLGHQVHVTYGGMLALDVATAFRPDLMLVDLLMPEMGGCEFTRHVRQISSFAKTKIMAVTGQKDNEDKALAMRAGFNDFLFKLASLAEIQTVLECAEPVAMPVGLNPIPVPVRASSDAAPADGGSPSHPQRTSLKSPHSVRKRCGDLPPILSLPRGVPRLAI